MDFIQIIVHGPNTIFFTKFDGSISNRIVGFITSEDRFLTIADGFPTMTTRFSYIQMEIITLPSKGQRDKLINGPKYKGQSDKGTEGQQNKVTKG